MRRIPKKNRVITLTASLVLAVGLAVGFYFFKPGEAAIYFNEIFLAIILILTIPSAVLDYLNQTWMDKIEDQIPTLVRGISESQETGVTLVDAIENVVENKMVRPPLSDEVNKITVQMSWGLSFEAALNKFKERIASPVVDRLCILITEASTSGGQLKKVFTATSGFMDEMREMDRDTAAQMMPYLIIIYAAFLVFMFTSIILIRSFFTPLEGHVELLTSASLVGVKDYKNFFYRTMLVYGLMGGLMAGKIGERRIAGGLKHSIFLVVVGYVLFYFLIPPNWMVT